MVDHASWVSTGLANIGSRFLIEDMTQADLLAEDKAFEIYLKDNGWEDVSEKVENEE